LLGLPDASKDSLRRLIPGLKPQDRLELRDRVIGPARTLQQCDGEIEMRRSIIRLQAQRLFILDNRVRGSSLVIEDIPKIVVRIDIIRLQMQSHFKLCAMAKMPVNPSARRPANGRYRRFSAIG